MAEQKTIDQLKQELITRTTHAEVVKKALENVTEVAELFQEHPDIIFIYRWIFGEKKISSGELAKKINKILPQIKEQTALKIAERSELRKQIRELESKK